jgi:hypothetical protein
MTVLITGASAVLAEPLPWTARAGLGPDTNGY